MAIETVVTRGFGNATYTGTIALVVTRGYLSSEPPSYGVLVPVGFTMFSRLPDATMPQRIADITMLGRLPDWTEPDRNE